MVSTVRGGELPGHNHRFEVVCGVREAECRELMQRFFKERRGDVRAERRRDAASPELARA